MGIIIRQSIKSTFVNYVGSFIGFLTTMLILPKFLQPEEIGLTRVVYEAAVLVCSFALLGTSSSILRFFPYFKNEKNDNNGFFFYILLFAVVGILIFVPLYILLEEPISAFFSRAILFVDYYHWVVPLIVILVFWSIFENYTNALMRIAVPKFIREVVVKVLLLIVYLLFAFKLLNLDWLIGCIIAVYGIAMLLTLAYTSRIGSISLKHNFSFLDKPLKKKVRNYTLFFLLYALSGSALSQLDLFMVGSQMGLEYAGIYTIAFFLGTATEVPARSISAISSPIAAKAFKENEIDTVDLLYKKVSIHQLVAGSFIFLLIWINIDNIFAIIPNGHKYAAGKWVVFFIGISRIIGVTLNFGSVLISFSKYYYWSLFFTFIITLTGIITNLLLIPVMGITGAAIATLISCSLSYLIQQVIIATKIKCNPFTINTLKQLLIIAAVFSVNFILPQYTQHPLIDGIYRSVITIGVMTFLIYKLKISDEICILIDKYAIKRNKI